MPTVLNTNIASLNASRNLLNAQNNLATSVMRLSSGMRINSASDDAAGLGVASSLTSQINGADQGIRNLNDAISMVQTAEGALAAASDMGQRILTLATQGANGTLGQKERDAIQVELKQLIVAIDSISSRTNFSDNKLLNGENSTDGFTIQVSADSNDTVALDNTTAFQDISSTGLASDMSDTISTDPMEQSDFGTLQGQAKTFIESIDAQRSVLGAYQNQMSYNLTNITELSTNLQAARSRIQDTDYAGETAKLTKGQIMQQAATAVADYTGAQQQLSQQQKNLNLNLGAIAATYGTTIPGALSLAGAAQVTSNQLLAGGVANWEVINTMVAGYITQLKIMVPGTGALNQALNASKPEL